MNEDRITIQKIRKSDLKTENVEIVMLALSPWFNAMRDDAGSIKLARIAIQYAIKGRSINDALMMVDFAIRPYLEPIEDPDLEEDTDETL